MAIKRLYDTLVGATVSVNQLVVKRTNPTVTDGDKSIAVDDGKIIITVNGSSGTPLVSVDWIVLQKNHKYLILANVPFSIGYEIYFEGYALANINYGYIINYTGNTGRNTLRCYVGSSAVVGTYEVYPSCIDLTAMFGSTIADYLYNLETATAGAGIAKLKEWGFFTEEYIPYNPGSLESVEATAHKMVGFNQWDEEWEVGSVDNNGQNVAYAGNMRSKNYIRVLPNTQYFATPKLRIVTYWYDGNKEFISMLPASDTAITSPPNAQYMRFRTTDAYGATYNNDICINLSNPDRNGEYEPYKANTYDLGTDTLRGLFKLDSENRLYADGDTKASDGTVTRKYGIVDLGTLNWTFISDASRNCFSVKIDDKKPGIANMICARYTNGIVYNTDTNMIVSGNNANGNIYIRDATYADAASFKAAMSGVMLVYELATPTTETSTSFQNPQICDPDGTEEYVTSNGVPVGHETRYQL